MPKTHHADPLTGDQRAAIKTVMDRSGLDELTAAGIVLARHDAAADAGGDWTSLMSGLTLTDVVAGGAGGVIVDSDSVATPVCSDCNGMGWYKEAVSFGHPNFGMLFPCHCTLAARAQAARTQRNALFARLASEMGDLQHCRLDTFLCDRPFEPLGGATAAQQRRDLEAAYQSACAYAAQPDGWLYLFGPVGGGKSHLAAAIGNAAVARDVEVRYASVPAFLDWIKDGFSDRSATQRIAALREAGLLILDDLGVEQESAYNDETLFKIAQHRDRYNLPTVLTSNVPVEQIEARLADRIRGRAQIARVAVSSYRAVQQRARQKRGHQ